MLGNVILDKKGEPENAELSLFQPKEEIKLVTARVKKDYTTGHNNLHSPFREFNDMSVITRMDKDQRAFNAYVEPQSLDPDDAWRWNGVTTLTRNAVMVMAAQMTARILFPNIFAQNDDDEEDRIVGKVMRDLILWHIENSNYEMSFLFSVISALVNPCAYLEVDFVESMQAIRTKLEDGSISVSHAVDEVFSGLQINNIPVDEVLIANPYGGVDIQRQRFIIRRRFVDFSELEGKYGEHENWKFVQPGVKAFYNEDDGTFYEQKDEDNPHLVEEVIYQHRTDDLEIPFVNGIYMGDSNVDNNPIKHRDNKDKPKYNIAHFGYHPIDEGKFFYYKSLVFTMENEQEFNDLINQLTANGGILSLMPPLGVMGDEKIDNSVFYPGAVTVFEKDTQLSPLSTGADLNAGFALLEQQERRVRESSSPEVIGGNLPDATQKAFNVARAEANARIKMSIFGKMIGWGVSQVGHLMIDQILTKQTVGQVDKIVGGVTKLKYKTFILNNQIEDGRSVDKKIIFDETLMSEMSEEEMTRRSFKVLKEQGGKDSNKKVVRLNPRKFRNLKFFIRVDPDSLIPRSEELERALNIEAYSLLVSNPITDREAVTRDFLVETFAPGESDTYLLPKEQIQQILGQGAIPGQGANPGQVGGNRVVESLLDQKQRQDVGAQLPTNI